MTDPFLIKIKRGKNAGMRERRVELLLPYLLFSLFFLPGETQGPPSVACNSAVLQTANGRPCAALDRIITAINQQLYSKRRGYPESIIQDTRAGIC